jgi:hypothetical protein
MNPDFDPENPPTLGCALIDLAMALFILLLELFEKK